MIDETKARIPCWLVWATYVNGNTNLEAISLVHSHAKYAKKILLEERGNENVVSVRIEPSECNHMFQADLDSKWLENYGKEASKRLVEFHTEAIGKDLTTAKKLGTRIIRALGNKNDVELRKAVVEWTSIFGMYQDE